MKVFVPTWNSERTLAGCLGRLILSMDRPEIVVIDKFSTDGTPKIAKSYGAEVIQKNWNLSEARTWICNNTSDEWFFMVDSDVYVMKEWYKNMITWRDKLLISDPKLGAVQSNDIDAPTIPEEDLRAQFYAYAGWRQGLRTFPNRNPRRFDPNACLVRGDAVRGFSCSWQGVEDYKLGEHIMGKGFSIYEVDVPVYHDELLTKESLKRRCRIYGANLRRLGYYPLPRLLAALLLKPVLAPSGTRGYTFRSYWNYLIGYMRVEKYVGRSWSQ